MRSFTFIVSMLLLIATACSSTPKTSVSPPTAIQVATATATIPSIPTGTARPIITYQPLGWWNQSVFYEIFVRSFQDSNGDGIGDFQGIIQRLDYLNDGNPSTNMDLGINAIWLMPIFPAASYHGYDVTDYMNVNPQYGTMDDFKQLLNAAHQHGIKVIIDYVINHTSDQHPWFKAAFNPDSKYHDYYIWSATDPGYLGPSGQKVWHLASNGLYYYGVFDASMPDLNYKNPAVTREIFKITQFWLKNVGVDGFRIDGARHLIEDGQKQVNTPETHAWFKEFRIFYKNINPDAVTVGEIWDSSSNIAGYVSGDELDMAFDFDLAGAMVGSAAGRSIFLTNTILSNDFPMFQNGLSMATFLTNHDMNRSFNSFGGITEKAKNAAAILLTMPGIPFIYYGEEIGMTGIKPDELIRTPMQWDALMNAGFTSGLPWEPVTNNKETVNVANEQADPQSLLSFYKEMIHLRTENPILEYGNYFPISYQDSSVMAELRTNGGSGLIVIINLTNKDIDNPVFSLSNSDLSGKYSVKDPGNRLQIADIQFEAQGSFENYSPILTLPANARLVLYLESKK